MSPKIGDILLSYSSEYVGIIIDKNIHYKVYWADGRIYAYMRLLDVIDGIKKYQRIINENL